MKMMKRKARQYLLAGMRDEIDWQCAHEAAKHSEPGKGNTLTYEVPGGDRTYVVFEANIGGEVMVRIRRAS